MLRPLLLSLLISANAEAADFMCTPTCYRGPDPSEKVSGERCGAEDLVCEASGSRVAKAINLLEFRISEAQKAKKSGNKKVCASAAASATATARGIPKFRKILKKGGEWGDGLTYLTRFSGKLDEKAAFARVGKLEKTAVGIWKKCGGKKTKTKEADEFAVFGGKPEVEAAEEESGSGSGSYKKVSIFNGQANCGGGSWASGKAVIKDSDGYYKDCDIFNGQCNAPGSWASGKAVVQDSDGSYKECDLFNGSCNAPGSWYQGDAVVWCED